MKFKLFASITFLIMLGGCTPSSSSTNVNNEISPTPADNLQITYIRNEADQDFGEFYAIDITCIMTDKVCFGGPKLLFRSLKMPNNTQSEPKGLLTDYSWSPDGKKIALISTGDILFGNVATQEWTNITSSPNVDEYQPKWSSDGKFIYYRACPRVIEGNYGGHSNCRIYRSTPTGSEKLALLRSIKASIISYDISSDGQKFAFSISETLGNLLYLANSDGTNSSQITVGDVSENAPSFSSDGQKIVFVRSTILYEGSSKEEADIIVKDLVSGEERNLTEKFSGMVFSPVFSPNGKWIAFDSTDAELNANIFLVSLEQKKTIQITQGNGETSPVWRRLSGQ